jgi:glycosyltransferase involved in cell wall biosynthesis
LRQFRPDIVHVHYPAAQCLPVVGASQFPRNWKLIVTVHNSDIRVSPFQEPRLRTWQARLFAYADTLTAVSQSLLDDAAELYPNFRRKAQVVHNGVGTRWFQLSLNQETTGGFVLYAGRLHTVKGVDLLLTAWKTVSARCPGTELWIVGDGPQRQNLEDLAARLKLPGVRFLGAKSTDELPTFYRDARVVVLPSRREGLPISLLEAGACGAICVGSRTPGIPEIIEEGITGYLVPVESVEEIAEAVSRVLELPPEPVWKMRKAARDRIAHKFSEQVMIEKYISTYQALQ